MTKLTSADPVEKLRNPPQPMGRPSSVSIVTETPGRSAALATVKCLVESIALPDDHGSSPSLFLRTVGAKVCPPKFASPQPRSSRSSAAAQSSRPAFARSASSL